MARRPAGATAQSRGRRRFAGVADARRGLALSLYLDASVLVGLFTQDAFTARARSVVMTAAEPLLVSDLATAEFASVISRLVRTGDMTAADAQAAFATLDAWKLRSAAIAETQPSDFTAAEAAMRRLTLSLRTPDALHVAIATRSAATLVTFDKRLARDARSLGVTVVEP